MHYTECSINMDKLKQKKKTEPQVDQLHMFESSSITIKIWNHKLKKIF